MSALRVTGRLCLFAFVCQVYIGLSLAESGVDEIVDEAEHALPGEFYDDNTESRLAKEAAGHADIIKSRKTHEAEELSSVDRLLDSLLKHIDSEKVSTSTQAGAEHDTNLADNTKEKAAAAKEQQDQLNTYNRALKTTTQANDIARAAHAAAEKRLRLATAEKTSADKQTTTAQAEEESTNRAEEKQEERCHLAADQQKTRMVDAITQRIRASLKFLQDGRKIVDTITDLLKRSVSGTGAGEGSRFPSLAETMNKLSIGQRLKMHALMNSKYVKKNRDSKSAADIRGLLEAITNSINDEEASILAAEAKSKAAAQTAANAEKKRCTRDKNSIASEYASFVATAVRRQSKAHIEFADASKLEATTGTKEAETDAAQKAAQNTLNTQTPILQAARDERDSAEQTRYENEAKRIDSKLTAARTYLSGEASTINKIKAAISGVGGEGSSAASELVQLSHRLVMHFVQMHSNSQYVHSLSDKADVQKKITEILNTLMKKSKVSKGQTSKRQETLNEENKSMRDQLRSQADKRLHATITKHNGLVKAAAGMKVQKQELLDKATRMTQQAAATKSNQESRLQDRLQEFQDELPALEKAQEFAKKEAEKNFVSSSRLATSKRTNSLKYLGEERDTIKKLREILGNLAGKSVEELTQDTTLSEEQQAAVQQVRTLYDNTKRAGYAGSEYSQKAKISKLLDQIDDTINKEEEKVHVVFKADSDDIAKDKRSANAAAEATYLSAKNVLLANVETEKTQLKFDTAVHKQKLRLQKTAQGEYDTADESWAAAKEAQKLEVQTAKTKKSDDYKQANTYFTERRSQIQDQTTAEINRLNQTINAVTKMRKLLEKLNFVASELMQYQSRPQCMKAPTKSDLHTQSQVGSPTWNAVKRKCGGGKHFFGWQAHAKSGSAAYVIAASGKLTAKFKNCWNVGTVEVYLRPKDGRKMKKVGSARAGQRGALVRKVTKGDVIIFVDEGKNSVVEVESFCVTSDNPCDAPSAAPVVEAYNACIAKPASLLSAGQLKSAFMMLHSKYISKNYGFEAAKKDIRTALNKIEKRLNRERTTLVSQYNLDVASSTSKRDKEIHQSTKVKEGVNTKHKQLVADAQTLRDRALGVQRSAQKEYTKLHYIRDDKQAALDAALRKQLDVGNAGRTKYTGEINAANLNYELNAARILKIKNDDNDYLNAELLTVETIQDIMDTIGIKHSALTARVPKSA